MSEHLSRAYSAAISGTAPKYVTANNPKRLPRANTGTTTNKREFSARASAEFAFKFRGSSFQLRPQFFSTLWIGTLA